MKVFKIILVLLSFLFLLISCGNDDDKLSTKKFTSFKSNYKGGEGKNPNKIKQTNNKNKSILVSKEVLFFEDKSKSPKEKIDFIKSNLDNGKEIFKKEANLRKSLDIALDYLDEKKKEEKVIENKNSFNKDDLLLEEKIEKIIEEQEEVKEIIKELIKEEESPIEALLYEGELQKIEENYEEAIGAFEEAFDVAETDEEKADALAGQGDVYQDMGNDEEAEDAYEEALTYDDENVAANLGDAQYDIDQGLLDEAEENLQNIIEQNLLDAESIELGVLNALILSLRGRYKESDTLLLGLIDNYGEDIEIYMLLIENNYFFSMIFRLNSIGLPLEQITPVLNSYKSKGLNYYNKALSLDLNRSYVYFYHGISKYLLGNKTSGIITVRTGLLAINNDNSLNTQEKKDVFTNYVDVVEKINTYNTTFDYTPAEFDVIIQADIGIFEKFYPMIDRDRLDQLTVVF